MKVEIVVVLALVAFVNGAAVAPANSFKDFGTAMGNFMSVLKNHLAHCLPSMVQPITVDHQKIDIETEYFSAKGSVSNLALSGIENLKVINLSYDKDSNTAAFDYMFPDIQLLGEYDMDSKVNVNGAPVDMGRAEGVLNMRFSDLRVVAGLVFAPSANKSDALEITKVTYNVYMANAGVHNWNNQWNIAGNNFANRIVRETLVMLSEQSHAWFGEMYTKAYMSLANNVLNNISIDQLVDIIVQATKSLDSDNCNGQKQTQLFEVMKLIRA